MPPGKSWKVMDFYFKISKTWKGLENQFGSRKSWKLNFEVLESLEFTCGSISCWN